MFVSPLNPNTRPAHAHYFRNMTGVTLQHAHLMDLFTYPVNGNGYDGHIHKFQGITKYALEGDRRHFHRFVSQTGPSIALPDGSHYHIINTQVDNEPFVHMGNYYRTIFTIERHVHQIYGPTSAPIGYEPYNW
jgi:hypothetical protein